MAAAFVRAGFVAHDVAMEDLRGGRADLRDFQGLALCGGFSFGDVLGGGRGWAEGILQNPRLAAMFAAFFADNNKFTFGACNGCQTLSLFAAADGGRRRVAFSALCRQPQRPL